MQGLRWSTGRNDDGRQVTEIKAARSEAEGRGQISTRIGGEVQAGEPESAAREGQEVVRMNRTQRGVTLSLLGSVGCLAFGVDGMLIGQSGGGVVQSPAWGFVFVGSILLLGLGGYLQLTSGREAKSDFLPFPKPGDLRRRKIRRQSDIS